MARAHVSYLMYCYFNEDELAGLTGPCKDRRPIKSGSDETAIAEAKIVAARYKIPFFCLHASTRKSDRVIYESHPPVRDPHKN